MVGHQRQVGPIGQRGSQRDHLLDALRPSLRQHLGEQAASAVPNQADARSSFGLDLDQPMAQAGQHSLRVMDV
jgi:hypothetical protein